MRSGQRAAEMIRIDLASAGIAYVIEGPDGPEYADFHSLRHSYLTLGGRSGIDLRTLQELAGHSKPELTARYSHRRFYDLAGAVEKLPNLVPPAVSSPHQAEIPLRRTGTEGPPAGACDPMPQRGQAYPKLRSKLRSNCVETGCISGQQTASEGLRETVGAEQQELQKSPEIAGNCSNRPSVASSDGSGPTRIRTENQGIMSPLL